MVPHFSIVGGYTGPALISYYDPTAPLPVTVTGTLVVNVNAAGKLEYDPSLTAPMGAVKSLTLTDPSFGATGKEHLIGRYPPSALNEIKLQLDKNGSLGFRSSPGGSPIGSYAEFQLINSDPVHLMGTYKLEADLDLMNELWEPVGNSGVKFAGTFDGSRKTLSNLKIEKAGVNDVGLFSVVGGEVKNLGILNGTVNGRDNVGGIAGSNEGAIFGCYYTGVMTGTGYNVGGVAGSVSGGGTITACYNEAAVNGGISVGGVAGVNNANITACYNTGAVTGGSSVGGIAGTSASNSNITACYNTGAVNGGSNVGSNVGGIAGISVSNSNITACYNTGAVTGGTNGGLVGSNNGSLNHCYYAKSTRNEIGAGTPGSTSGLFTDDTDFPNVSGVSGWGIGLGQSPTMCWKSGTTGGGKYPKLFFE
ncbi:hypothetical protein AGMMS49546_14520 [Spirochaetia bacterium]|nr:hypothetical protein AGMMS49546_14520 [Spirochaetia bacterium]